ncbi:MULTISPECIES: aldo/keto reductase [Microbacterium]|uniref:aldo/keto reductase n=1 Tax=Microbacterium TaxID=33882 RepID=UPI00214AA71E|nr:MULTISPECIES: aldo/keto reductase [unclassified Microbacterium]MCR2813324.1 aldo/keto reductase [Microbacterium sp. zg.Y1084]MDL5487953.1 aldo/keto reductase [Microbacterium sp. zg-Y1211]
MGEPIPAELALRPLGDLQVSAIGMGAMTLTQVPDADTARGVRAVHAALDAGVTLFDTADSYGPTEEMGVNERALIAALRTHPGDLSRVVVATKGGHTRGPNATWWIDGSPAHLARAARASLRRLGLDALPLYQHHRPDPRVPFADSMGALRALVDDGIAQRVGVSNVDSAQLSEAIEIVGPALVSVQNELSPLAPPAADVLRQCEAHGLALLAWGPLGGMREAKALGDRARAIAAVARARAVSPQRIALAWLLRLSPVIIPIPGASRPESIVDSAAAAGVVLDDDEMRVLGGAVQ